MPQCYHMQRMAEQRKTFEITLVIEEKFRKNILDILEMLGRNSKKCFGKAVTKI